LNQVLRSQVVALALAEVRDAVRGTSKAYGIAPSVTNAVTRALESRIAGATPDTPLEESISDGDRIIIGLVALANRERRLILDHHAQQSVSVRAIEVMLRNTNAMLDGAKAEGRAGYDRAARRQTEYTRLFRIAHFLHWHFGIDRPLQRQISTRFETLLVRGLALEALAQFNRQRLRPLLGELIDDEIGEVIAARAGAVARAIDALRLQYPDHAEALERHFLRQTGLQLELSLFRELLHEGLIGRELYDALEREHAAERADTTERRPLDLGLRSEELITRFDIFRNLAPPERAALARLFRPRLALPEEKIVNKGERGGPVFFISSGAVEVVLPHQKVRLGRGDFFGEMALLSGRRRSADVLALGYCQLLVLNAADFRRFLAANAGAKAEIDRIVEARTQMNQEAERLLPSNSV
jgi:CPA1 family monovalent cation:H+ antiporter